MSAKFRKPGILKQDGTEVQFTPKANVVICIPCGDQVSTGFMQDVVKMVAFTTAQAPEIQLRLNVLKGTLLPSMRATLAKEALVSDKVTHLFYLDSDMRFPPTALVRLLGHNKDIVAASYVTRRFPTIPVTFGFSLGTADRIYVEDTDTGLKEVGATGMGVFLVKAEVFRKTPKPWFALGYVESLDEFSGEDAWFCARATAAGFKTWIDCDLTKEVMHVGEFEFENHHSLIQRDTEANES